MNILFLSHRVPYPPDKGDRIRSYHMLRHLGRQHDVSLVALADERVTDQTRRELERVCRRVALIPISSKRWITAAGTWLRGGSITEGAHRSILAQRAIRQWAGESKFDVAIAYCSSMAPYLEDACLRGVPAVCDLVDVDSQKWLDYAAASRRPRRWIYAMEGRRVRQLEERIIKRCDAVTLVSEQEADLFRSGFPSDRIHAVPNGVDLDYFQPAAERRGAVQAADGCVFVGALDYYPNVAGISWFCERVWPHVRKQHPGAMLTIVGRNPSPAVQKLGECVGVRVVGTVPDVRPYLAEASVAISPLQIARGVQNKVLEAMAMGKPVLASPAAIGGIAVAPGRDVLCARSEHEWIGKLCSLLKDEGLRSRLAVRALAFVENRHRWSACLEPLDELIGSLPGVASVANHTAIARRHLPAAVLSP
jgi:sugar transferase (PEP-CTERM/EpsH1 system associated)